jgi:hypothetical protein
MPQGTSNIKRVLTLVVAFIILCSIAVILYIKKTTSTSTSNNEEENGVVSSTKADEQLSKISGAKDAKKIALVSDEYLFESDLIYYAFQQGKEVKDLDRGKAIEDIVNDSVLLQFGAKENMVELTPNVFNNPFKDMQKRMEVIAQIKQIMSESIGKAISWEGIAVWFYNVNPADLAEKEGMEKAKQFAYDKINAVYNEVVNNGKKMSEAAEILKNDETLIQLDKSYKGNAYFVKSLDTEIHTIDDIRKGRTFGYTGLFDFLLKAEIGDISKIYLEQDTPDGDNIVDAYYAFYKLTNKSQGTSIEELVQNFKTSLSIQIYN